MNIFEHFFCSRRAIVKTITLPGGATITTDSDKATRFIREIAKLSLTPKSKTEYVYEFVDGSVAVCTFVAWENLNLIVRRVDDGTEFRIPSIDMGDGSLCTDYLKLLRRADLHGTSRTK
jgi:hypothetical protein